MISHQGIQVFVITAFKNHSDHNKDSAEREENDEEGINVHGHLNHHFNEEAEGFVIAD